MDAALIAAPHRADFYLIFPKFLPLLEKYGSLRSAIRLLELTKRIKGGREGVARVKRTTHELVSGSTRR